MGTRRIVLALLAVAAIGGIVVLPARPAPADCSGPRLTHDAGPLVRGDSLTVTGGGFGDQCYDTGPPPPGEGALGRPTTGIEIVLTQPGREVVVARGDAEADYRFRVDVVVPAALAPGTACVTFRSPGYAASTDPCLRPVVIAGDPPLGDSDSGGDEDGVATFGLSASPTPPSTTTTGPPAAGGRGPSKASARPDGDGGGVPLALVTGLAVAAVVVAGGLAVAGRRRAGRLRP